jgi:hypothetical protein
MTAMIPPEPYDDGDGMVVWLPQAVKNSLKPLDYLQPGLVPVGLNRVI